MKIIHTSDWHLGQDFYSYDRTEEHLSFLQQLRCIVEKEIPDALVISGDIFHTATPSNAIMKIFNDQLDSIRKICPSMTTIVIAGNHDSGSRLEIAQTLWEHLNVHIISKIQKEDQEVCLRRHIIPIKNRDNQICGYVVALPYIVPQAFPLLKPDTPREKRECVFLEMLSAEIEKINISHLPVVMMAHMAITGSDITGHDMIQGGMDYINVSELKVDFDYLALGHIHCPQMIRMNNDTACARYCGSPVPVSFDEKYVHSVSVVEIKGHKDKPVIKTIPIQNPWPLKTIPDIPTNFDDSLHVLESFPIDEKAYIRLQVKLSDVPPQNALERATRIVKDKQCRFCCFKWVKESQGRDAHVTFQDVDQIKTYSPLSVAEIYYQNKFGHPLQTEYKDMLAEIIQEVQCSQSKL